MPDPREPRPFLSSETEIFRQHPEVAWSEGRERREGLQAAFAIHRKTNPEFWRGLVRKTVLIKPNMGDSEHPLGCTHPDALTETISQLVASGVNHILIGDIPMLEEVEKMRAENRHAQDTIQRLGYQKVIEEARQKHPTLIIETTDLLQSQPTRLPRSGVNIHIPPVAVVVNMALPKEHGQYHFTCGSKNFMGLSSPSDRKAYFHNHGTPEEIQQIVNSIVAQEGAQNFQNHEQLLGLYKRAWAQAANGQDNANADRMTTFVEDVIKTLAQRSIQVLTIVDGTHIVLGHEHRGTPQNIRITAIGLNPLAVDRQVQQRLGSYAPYIDKITGKNRVEPVNKGDPSRNIPSRKNRRFIEIFKETPEGQVFFRYRVKSEPIVQTVEKQPEQKLQLTLEIIGKKEHLAQQLLDYETAYKCLASLIPLADENEKRQISNTQEIIRKKYQETKKEIARLQETYDWEKIPQEEIRPKISRGNRYLDKYLIYSQQDGITPEEYFLKNFRAKAREEHRHDTDIEVYRLFRNLYDQVKNPHSKVSTTLLQRLYEMSDYLKTYNPPEKK